MNVRFFSGEHCKLTFLEWRTFLDRIMYISISLQRLGHDAANAPCPRSPSYVSYKIFAWNERTHGVYHMGCWFRKSNKTRISKRFKSFQA